MNVTETADMFFTVVINVYPPHQAFLPRALTSLLNQRFSNFELIIIVEGETPLNPYDPRQLCRQTIPARIEYRPSSHTSGNRERNFGLSLAHGRYILWLNADNLVYPDWLENHYANLASNSGAISIVNIQYWRNELFRGKLPIRLACGEMDLLNFALPLELATSLSVFGPEVEHLRFADWLAFEQCAKSAPVIWDREQPICACHY